MRLFAAQLFRGLSHDKVRLNSKPCDFARVLLDFSSENTWHLSCSPLGERISFSLLRRNMARGEMVEMLKLLRQLLLAIAMLGVVSAGAFAQRKDQDKRPPKEPAKVITNDRKDQRPPPQNTNQQRPKQDKRERPD
jgi:hypothetical protein